MMRVANLVLFLVLAITALIGSVSAEAQLVGGQPMILSGEHQMMESRRFLLLDEDEHRGTKVDKPADKAEKPRGDDGKGDKQAKDVGTSHEKKDGAHAASPPSDGHGKSPSKSFKEGGAIPRSRFARLARPIHTLRERFTKLFSKLLEWAKKIRRKFFGKSKLDIESNKARFEKDAGEPVTLTRSTSVRKNNDQPNGHLKRAKSHLDQPTSEAAVIKSEDLHKKSVHKDAHEDKIVDQPKKPVDKHADEDKNVDNDDVHHSR